MPVQPVEPGPGFTLVLGAGGRVGMASHAGVLRALADVAGLDPADADLVIGTSAGAVVGALVRLGWSTSQIWGIVTRTSPVDPAEDIGRADLFHRAWHTPSQLVRRGLGSAYVLARSAVRVPLLPVPRFARRLFPSGFLTIKEEEADLGTGIGDTWPDEPLWLCTVSVESGKRVVLGRRDDRPSLSRAVLASCAIPGYYQPVRFDGRTLVDGGVHSTTNLDLAAASTPRLVVASVPMGCDDTASPAPLVGSIRSSVNRGTRQATLELEATGRTVLVLQPGRREVVAQGFNVMRDRDLESVAVAAYDAAARRLARPQIKALLESASSQPPVESLAG